jgi:predicted nucleotidyltransferase
MPATPGAWAVYNVEDRTEDRRSIWQGGKVASRTMATAREFTAEEIAVYRATALRRQQAEREAVAVRERRARELAHEAADLLRREFHADRVFLFGSLIHPGCFHSRSDVDVAADGIDSLDTLEAMEMVHDLSDEIEVNLVDLNACRASLRATIEREGQPL